MPLPLNRIGLDVKKNRSYSFFMAESTWTYQDIVFVCDEAKRRENIRKHGIDLCEASAVFFDPLACARHDLAHGEHEDRVCILGRSEGGRLLFVVYTIRGETVRIISARRAKQHEVKKYA
jgi:uncharacterized DUF497 family protein